MRRNIVLLFGFVISVSLLGGLAGLLATEASASGNSEPALSVTMQVYLPSGVTYQGESTVTLTAQEDGGLILFKEHFQGVEPDFYKLEQGSVSIWVTDIHEQPVGVCVEGWFSRCENDGRFLELNLHPNLMIKDEWDVQYLNISLQGDQTVTLNIPIIIVNEDNILVHFTLDEDLLYEGFNYLVEIAGYDQQGKLVKDKIYSRLKGGEYGLISKDPLIQSVEIDIILEDKDNKDGIVYLFRQPVSISASERVAEIKLTLEQPAEIDLVDAYWDDISLFSALEIERPFQFNRYLGILYVSGNLFSTPDFYFTLSRREWGEEENSPDFFNYVERIAGGTTIQINLEDNDLQWKSITLNSLVDEEEKFILSQVTPTFFVASDQQELVSLPIRVEDQDILWSEGLAYSTFHFLSKNMTLTPLTLEYEWMQIEKDDYIFSRLYSWQFVQDLVATEQWSESSWTVDLDLNWKLTLQPQRLLLNDQLTLQITDQLGSRLEGFQSREIEWLHPEFYIIHAAQPLDVHFTMCREKEQAPAGCFSISSSKLPVEWKADQAGKYTAQIDHGSLRIGNSEPFHFKVVPFSRMLEEGKITVRSIVDYLKTGGSHLNGEQVEELLSNFVDSYYD